MATQNIVRRERRSSSRNAIVRGTLAFVCPNSSPSSSLSRALRALSLSFSLSLCCRNGWQVKKLGDSLVVFISILLHSLELSQKNSTSLCCIHLTRESGNSRRRFWAARGRRKLKRGVEGVRVRRGGGRVSSGVSEFGA